MARLVGPLGPRIGWIALVGVVFTVAGWAQEFTTDPAMVRLEVSDLRRLGAVAAAPDWSGAADKAVRIEREYLGHASPGLRAYVGRYSVTPASIATAMAEQKSAYADLTGLADRILASRPAYRSAFDRLVAVVPGAVFTPIWFVAGHYGPGGMAQPVGVIVAAERFAHAPDDLVPLVLHELGHIQQFRALGPEAFGRIYSPTGTLLDRALREGGAELVAELTTGRHINPAAEAYGLAHERELWLEFRDDLSRTDAGDWMFRRPANRDWPNDLGYWIGYRIARTYYDRLADKRQAIEDILGISDATAFLARSGYPDRMAR